MKLASFKATPYCHVLFVCLITVAIIIRILMVAMSRTFSGG